LVTNKHFNFSGYKKVIDMGGGFGDNVFSICSENRQIQGIIFEMDGIIDAGKSYWNNKRIDINEYNMSYVCGDFFSKDDVYKYCNDCDVITMKRILHDWTDDECTVILNNISHAMGSDNSKRLLICDAIIGDELNNTYDLGYKLLDIEIGYILTGKERTLKEFDALLGECGFNRCDGYPKSLANLHVTAYQPK